MSVLEQKLMEKLNILTKWRSVFAGWQLGTRSKEDPECQAVRDHREVTILMRAELSAMLGLLVKAGVFSREEFQRKMIEEADALNTMYEKRFPGMKANIDGIEMDIAKASETMKGWRP
jgi:hypothetical protein